MEIYFILIIIVLLCSPIIYNITMKKCDNKIIFILQLVALMLFAHISAYCLLLLLFMGSSRKIMGDFYKKIWLLIKKYIFLSI